MRERYIRVCRVEKTYGSSGEVVVDMDCGLSLRLEPGTELYFVPPLLEGLNSAKLEQVVDSCGSGLRLKLEGVDDIQTASQLVARYALAADRGLPSEELSLIGRGVECEVHGSIGEITQVMHKPANDVWVVQGPFGEVLVPVIDSVVLDIPQTGDIRVHLLPGLLDCEAEYDKSDEGAVDAEC